MSHLGRHRPAPPGNPHPLCPPLTPQAHAQAHLRHLRPLGPSRERWRIRIEAHVRALHARGPLIQYWWEGDKDGRIGICVVQASALDPSRGLGMGGGWGGGGGVSAMYWQSWAIPPLDPSTLLPPRRILQRQMFHLRQGERPLPGMDSGSRGAECKAGSGFGSETRRTLGMPCCRMGRHPDASIVLIVEHAQEIASKGEQDE